MRVIAGTARGRRLKSPSARPRERGHNAVRPSSDLIRGAIFSALQSLGVRLTSVLDLYAGSGALGIEALSRGAESCDFIERDRAACAVIRENLRLTGFDERARVHCLSAEQATARLEGVFSLVLADPPYADSNAASVLAAVSASSLVEPGNTIIVLEHSARAEPAAALGPFALANSRRHGDSAVSIYR
ncbi:MAG TPA: 16S rRNA (guanine(966)-N(2))-methyltransferase RsmD [Dehalococcoidia bacterium]|nr:16S rRNA (guanine(966)-N(2))-methyltransferase RsmD [Dehalococcoidia bacterium]